MAKGETSGNTLDLKQLITDCDKDSLIALAQPNGPTCHLGTTSCFPESNFNQRHFISILESVIASRKDADASESYTAQLFAKGMNKIAQKVGEEGVEVALAGVAEDDAALLGESADLLFHLIVLLQARGLTLNDVMNTLIERHK